MLGKRVRELIGQNTEFVKSSSALDVAYADAPKYLDEVAIAPWLSPYDGVNPVDNGLHNS